MRNLYLVLLAVILLVVACQKEVNDFTPPPPVNGDCMLTRIVQGTGIDDTVFLIKYDTLKRIQVLIDSVYEDTITATYTDKNKYPDRLELASGGGVGYDYNSTGKVIEVAGLGNRITMQYTGDQLSSASSFYRDNNTWKPARNYVFHYDGSSNLTKIEEFTTSNVLHAQLEITYSAILNPFNDLPPYNFSNMLGMDDIFPAFMFIHNAKYLPKTIRDGGLAFELNYKQNSIGQVISSVATLKNTTNNNIEYVATRYYFYKCP